MKLSTTSTVQNITEKKREKISASQLPWSLRHRCGRSAIGLFFQVSVLTVRYLHLATSVWLPVKSIVVLVKRTFTSRGYDDHRTITLYSPVTLACSVLFIFSHGNTHDGCPGGQGGRASWILLKFWIPWYRHVSRIPVSLLGDPVWVAPCCASNGIRLLQNGR